MPASLPTSPSAPQAQPSPQAQSSPQAHPSPPAHSSSSARSRPPELAAADRAAGRAADPEQGGGSRAGAAHLIVDGVAFSYPGRRVLREVSFTARPGDRIGVIGENGAGKSTLLRIISGDLQPDAGVVSVPGALGRLAQELPYPPDSPISRVLDDAQGEAGAALNLIARLASALAQRPDDPVVAREYSAALETAERLGAWSAEALRGETLAGLGLGGIPETHPIGELSGGQRLRLALAAVLLRAPHTLLLDEPSNHLDDASAAYLERVLSGWPGIVLLVSHDRALLDSVATRILDLDPLALPASLLADAATGEHPAASAAASPGLLGPPGPRGAHGPDAGRDTVDSAHGLSGADGTHDTGTGLAPRLWGVGYSAARAERREELRRWRARYERELAEREALVHEIEIGSREVNKKHESKSESRITRKFYADKDARVTARRARNARARLDALELDRVRRPPEPLRFAGFGPAARGDGAAGGTGGPVGEGAGGAAVAPSGLVTAADPPALTATRVSLPGRLRETSLELPARGRLLLAGENGAGKSTLLAILAGELRPASGGVERNVPLGYLPQEAVFARTDLSAAEWFRHELGVERAEAHPLAATGLLAPRDRETRVGELSVGQRRRLALAALVADPPPVLLLDEPTNHLSLTLVEELEEALESFTGALVIATHDRWLRARWRGETLTL